VTFWQFAGPRFEKLVCKTILLVLDLANWFAKPFCHVHHHQQQRQWNQFEITEVLPGQRMKA
jgi:hypothetical protein